MNKNKKNLPSSGMKDGTLPDFAAVVGGGDADDGVFDGADDGGAAGSASDDKSCFLRPLDCMYFCTSLQVQIHFYKRNFHLSIHL